MKNLQSALRLALESVEQDQIALQDGQGIAALESMQFSLEGYLDAAEQLVTMATGLESLYNTVDSIPKLDAGHIALIRLSTESLFAGQDWDLNVLTASLEADAEAAPAEGGAPAEGAAADDAKPAEGKSRWQQLKELVLRLWDAAKRAFDKVWEFVKQVFRKTTDVEKELLLKIKKLRDRVNAAQNQTTKSPKVQLTQRHVWLSEGGHTPADREELNKILVQFANVYGFMGQHYTDMLGRAADDCMKAVLKNTSDANETRTLLHTTAMLFSPDSMTKMVPGAHPTTGMANAYAAVPIIADRQLVITGRPLGQLPSDEFMNALKHVGLQIRQTEASQGLTPGEMTALTVADLRKLIDFAEKTLAVNSTAIAEEVTKKLDFKFKLLINGNDAAVKKLTEATEQDNENFQKLVVARELSGVIHLLSKWAAAPLTQMNLIVMHVTRALLSMISTHLENFEGIQAEKVDPSKKVAVEQIVYTFEGEGEEVIDPDSLESDEQQEPDVNDDEVSLEASTKDLKNGMRVKFSHGHGKIAKVFTAPFKLDGKHHKASKDAPIYLVKHDKGGKHSLHKASALTPAK